MISTRLLGTILLCRLGTKYTQWAEIYEKLQHWEPWKIIALYFPFLAHMCSNCTEW